MVVHQLRSAYRPVAQSGCTCHAKTKGNGSDVRALEKRKAKRGRGHDHLFLVPAKYDILLVQFVYRLLLWIESAGPMTDHMIQTPVPGET